MISSKTVMVIDDDHRLNRLLQLVLESSGYSVRAFTDARDALRSLDGTRPDVIVLDLRMPGMDGYEFYGELKRREIDVPVIVASAFGAPAAREELGAAAALPKPFLPDELVDLVGQVVQD
jgi:two-component system, NtrC family, C4-dicarboxylate transport response regulator DctD